jgi:hypothetical protein
MFLDILCTNILTSLFSYFSSEELLCFLTHSDSLNMTKRLCFCNNFWKTLESRHSYTNKQNNETMDEKIQRLLKNRIYVELKYWRLKCQTKSVEI